MATSNPHESDPAKGEIWELGYLAGWQDPEQDHVLPFAPGLLDVYQAGDLAGLMTAERCRQSRTRSRPSHPPIPIRWMTGREPSWRERRSSI